MREIAGIGEQLGVAHHRFELKYGGHTFLKGFTETVISRDFLFDNLLVSERPPLFEST